MNVVFCCDAFKVDGIGSYNLYLSAALRRAGHRVAIVSRWGGRGFQKRHRVWDVRVIQPALYFGSRRWLVHRTKQFRPDVIITDARRSFPLSQRIRQETGAPVITVFHDPPRNWGKHDDMDTLAKGSHVWVSQEKPIYRALCDLGMDTPVRWISRPISCMIQPTPLPRREPFRLVCLGRLSGWKFWAASAIVENAVELRKTIPSLEIVVVGGGGRLPAVWWAAKKANRQVGRPFVRVVGNQVDPQPWISEARAVCAGATSAIEAILSDRPVLAASGYWMGLVTQENLAKGVLCHFGEREGTDFVRDRPDLVCDAVIDLYHQWKGGFMSEHVASLRERLAPDFDAGMVAEEFDSLFERL